MTRVIVTQSMTSRLRLDLAEQLHKHITIGADTPFSLKESQVTGKTILEMASETILNKKEEEEMEKLPNTPEDFKHHRKSPNVRGNM